MRLIGGEANDPQLQSILNGVLPIPSEVGKLMQNVNLGKLKPADRRGSLSEWTVALGLSLRQTTTYFAGRDGTTRQAAAANVDLPATPQAEVVDLNQVPSTGIAPATEPTPAKPEVVHA